MNWFAWSAILPRISRALLFLAEAAQEGPHRVGVRVRVLSPLGCRALGKQHERADQFVAPLDLVHKLELELRKIPRWFHDCSLPPAPLGPPSGAMMVGVRPNPCTATCSCRRASRPACTRREWGLVMVREGTYCRGT
jgi:hypothetical protein